MPLRKPPPIGSNQPGAVQSPHEGLHFQVPTNGPRMKPPSPRVRQATGSRHSAPDPSRSNNASADAPPIGSVREYATKRTERTEPFHVKPADQQIATSNRKDIVPQEYGTGTRTVHEQSCGSQQNLCRGTTACLRIATINRPNGKSHRWSVADVPLRCSFAKVLAVGLDRDRMGSVPKSPPYHPAAAVSPGSRGEHSSASPSAGPLMHGPSTNGRPLWATGSRSHVTTPPGRLRS
jgi:hypothetical protein